MCSDICLSIYVIAPARGAFSDGKNFEIVSQWKLAISFLFIGIVFWGSSSGYKELTVMCQVLTGLVARIMISD